MRLYSFVNKTDVPYEPQELGRTNGLHVSTTVDGKTIKLQFRAATDDGTQIVVELNADETAQLRKFLEG